MKAEEEDYLRRIVGDLHTHKIADNPLDNSFWSNLIDGALKGLEIVAIASLDWKLTGIVKLLQSWLKDKREEKQRRDQQELYGWQSQQQEVQNEWTPPTYY